MQHLDYLEAKLIHIRQRVEEYDEWQLAEVDAAALSPPRVYRLQQLLQQQADQPR